MLLAILIHLWDKIKGYENYHVFFPIWSSKSTITTYARTIDDTAADAAKVATYINGKNWRCSFNKSL
jgi:hypothetical protein